MDSLLKRVPLDDLGFEICSSQQIATVLFDRQENSETASITVLRDGKITQFDGHNKYNPSKRRHASCVYVREECSDDTIKICTIQHKGITFVELHSVSDEEQSYLLLVE